MEVETASRQKGVVVSCRERNRAPVAPMGGARQNRQGDRVEKSGERQTEQTGRERRERRGR